MHHSAEVRTNALWLVLGSEGSEGNNGKDNKLVGNPISDISLATVVSDLHGISLIVHNILAGFSDMNIEVLIIERTWLQSPANE